MGIVKQPTPTSIKIPPTYPKVPQESTPVMKPQDTNPANAKLVGALSVAPVETPTSQPLGGGLATQLKQQSDVKSLSDYSQNQYGQGDNQSLSSSPSGLIQPLQNNPLLPKEGENKENPIPPPPKKTGTTTAAKADPNAGMPNIFDENGNPISGDKYWGTEKPMSGAEYWGWEEKQPTEEANTGDEKSFEPATSAQTFLPSESQLFGKLVTGQDTSTIDPNSIEYQRAESRSRELTKIASLGAQGIVDGLAGGSILKGSRALQDLAQYYPELQKEIQAIQKKQQDLDMANSLSTGKAQGSMIINTTQDQQAVNDSLNQTVVNMGGTQEAYDILQEGISKDTDLQYFSDKSAYYASEIDKLDQTIDNLGQDIRKRMGADTPEYMIQAYINNRSGKLYQNRNQLLRQYNQYTAMYQSRVEEIEREKEWEYKERQLAMQQQQYDRSWAMDQSSNALNWSKFNAEYGGEVGTMRTERNNNPTAMTTDVARSLGLVEGVDYVQGDVFSDNPNLFTARLLGDPIETTIKGLDNAAKTGLGAFYTKGGKQRRTYTAMKDDERLALSHEEKQNFILGMLKNEGGDINKLAYYAQNNSGDKNASLYKNLANGTITYNNFVKDFSGDVDQETKNEYIGWSAVQNVNSVKELDSVVNFLDEKISNKDVVEAEYYAMNGLNLSERSNPEIIKLVNEYNDLYYDKSSKSDSRAQLLAIALEGRYTKRQELEDELADNGVYWNDSLSKKIWKIWKEEGLVS